jgi:hypothetical protein
VRLNALDGSFKLAGEDEGASKAPIRVVGVQLECALEFGNR